MTAHHSNLAVVLAITTLVAAGVACGESRQTYHAQDFEDGSPAAEATVTATPEPISAEDAVKVYAVIGALRTQDVETVRPHVGYRKIACAAVGTIGGPPKCAGGESDGDEIEAFYYSACEGQYLRSSEIDQPLDALTQMDVYDAYRIPRKTDSGYEYSIVLEDHATAREGYAWEAILNNGQIIGLLFSCSLPPEDLVNIRGYEQRVPAPEPAELATPVP